MNKYKLQNTLWYTEAKLFESVTSHEYKIN